MSSAPPSASPPVRRASRLTPALVLAVTFALGALAGLGVAPLLRPHPRPGLPPGMHELSLRPEQERAVEGIVAKHAPEVDEALADALPRLRVVQDRVAVEIEGVLDEDQKAKFRRQRAGRAPSPPPRP